jgi:peptide chain release factor 1
MWPKLDETLKKFHEVEQQLADPEITVDHVKYNRLAKEHGNLAKMAKPYLEYKKVDSDIRHLETGIEAEADAEMQQMMQEELRTLREKRDGLHSKLEDMLLVDPSEDFDSIIVEVRAGVGGDEAALFAGDLYRMYVRYAESQGWKVETLDFNGTELGGFKEVSFNVAGEGCYRQLRFESGGHRVQRVPDTETQGRIHTSAATVAVMPEPTEIQIQIKVDDVRIDTFSTGGPGGQHQNKTQSGVRLTHIPTGTVAESRTEKSQHKNKDICWRVLRTRIYERLAEKERVARAAQRKSLVGSGDRSERIRTYNYPQNRVTDHRINLNLYKLDAIMAGSLQELIRAMLDYEKKTQLEELSKVSTNATPNGSSKDDA